MTEGTAFDDSLKRLYEKPLRLTLFAASMRILFKHLMDTLAPATRCEPAAGANWNRTTDKPTSTDIRNRM